ncbi:zinc finger MYM-type protein 6-like [Diabrotica undecimpunctata]|uniref:zinc finger MYM-type protein 6-like n=1 Tax=Diabrotica undecimpunctata TaxID=50387 RepID=UPI003B633375
MGTAAVGSEQNPFKTILQAMRKAGAELVDTRPWQKISVQWELLEVKYNELCEVESAIFAVQLEESTDITNTAILLVYIRFIDKDNKKLSEEFLTSIVFQGNTTGKDIFKAIDGYLTLKNLSWKDCVGLCSDGAAAMTGHKTGLPSFVREEGNRDIVLTYCIIHREMLAAKRLSPNLNKVLTTVVKTVNFIKSNALSSRLFALLCEDLGSIHSNLLLHTEVRWLSRSRVLARFYELREKVCMYLDEKT